MSVLVFVSRDFELGRTSLTGGVDRQSRMGLIFLISNCCLQVSNTVIVTKGMFS